MKVERVIFFLMFVASAYGGYEWVRRSIQPVWRPSLAGFGERLDVDLLFGKTEPGRFAVRRMVRGKPEDELRPLLLRAAVELEGIRRRGVIDAILERLAEEDIAVALSACAEVEALECGLERADLRATALAVYAEREPGKAMRRVDAELGLKPGLWHDKRRVGYAAMMGNPEGFVRRMSRGAFEWKRWRSYTLGGRWRVLFEKKWEREKCEVPLEEAFRWWAYRSPKAASRYWERESRVDEGVMLRCLIETDPEAGGRLVSGDERRRVGNICVVADRDLWLGIRAYHAAKKANPGLALPYLARSFALHDNLRGAKLARFFAPELLEDRKAVEWVLVRANSGQFRDVSPWINEIPHSMPWRQKVVESHSKHHFGQDGPNSASEVWRLRYREDRDRVRLAVLGTPNLGNTLIRWDLAHDIEDSGCREEEVLKVTENVFGAVAATVSALGRGSELRPIVADWEEHQRRFSPGVIARVAPELLESEELFRWEIERMTSGYGEGTVQWLAYVPDHVGWRDDKMRYLANNWPNFIAKGCEPYAFSKATDRDFLRCTAVAYLLKKFEKVKGGQLEIEEIIAEVEDPEKASRLRAELRVRMARVPEGEE